MLANHTKKLDQIPLHAFKVSVSSGTIYLSRLRLTLIVKKDENVISTAKL
jgi:hypothetical protein